MSHPAGSLGAPPKLWLAVLTTCDRYGGAASYAHRLLPSGLNSTLPASGTGAAGPVVAEPGLAVAPAALDGAAGSFDAYAADAASVKTVIADMTRRDRARARSGTVRSLDMVRSQAQSPGLPASGDPPDRIAPRAKSSARCARRARPARRRLLRRAERRRCCCSGCWPPPTCRCPWPCCGRWTPWRWISRPCWKPWNASGRWNGSTESWWHRPPLGGREASKASPASSEPGCGAPWDGRRSGPARSPLRSWPGSSWTVARPSPTRASSPRS